MRLSDFIQKDFVIEDLRAKTKSEVLAELVGALSHEMPDLDLQKAFRVLQERECLGTTGIGDGVAIPHGKMEKLEKIVIVAGRSKQGVDFEALDFKPCFMFFLVLAPEHVAGMHLRLLAHISRLLSDEIFRKSFLEAPAGDALWEMLSGY